MSAPERGHLHQALRSTADAATPRGIDLDVVLRESRARRRARRTAVAGGAGALAAVLAVGGLVVGMRQGFGPASGGGPAAVESAESGDAPSAAERPEAATGFRLMAPDDVNRCGETVAAPTDASTARLALSVTTPAGPVAPGASLSITVTLTNAGDTHLEGEVLGMPSLTIADDGVVVWRPDAVAAEPAPVAISLAPGASTTLVGALEAETCGLEDAAAPSAPPASPLPAGAYELGAIVAFTPTAGEPALLISPSVPLAVG